MDNYEITKEPANSFRKLRKTAGICFWLYIVKFLLSNTFLPIGLLIAAVHIVLMLWLGTIDSHFRTAGIIEALSLAVRFLIPDLSPGISDILRDLSIQALNLLWAYHEFTGFSNALAECAFPMSDKWRTVRNWYIVANVATSIAIPLYPYAELVMNPILLFSIIASAVMNLVICVNYWRTYKLCGS